MSDVSAAEVAISTLNLPAFDGFPYLVVKLGPAFYHLLLLPGHCSIEDPKTLARCQAQANDLQVCLALNHRRGIYYAPDGGASEVPGIPRGGIVTCCILKPSSAVVGTEELAQREHLLREYVEIHNPDGYAFGDVTKGGRDATADEAWRLVGIQPNGVPNGLKKCERCGDWRGECLDPSPNFAGKVMRVNCLCENHNLCARCGERLCERKVNANYYSEEDGGIWHVPGFSALKHRCAGGRQWKA